MFLYKNFNYEGELDVSTIKTAALSLWVGDNAPTGVGVLEGAIDPTITRITLDKPIIVFFGVPVWSKTVNLPVSVRPPQDLMPGQFMVSYHPTRGPSKNLE